jgi:hypothetical protein
MFGVLYRSFDKMLVSVPMFVIFFGILRKATKSQGYLLLGPGIWTQKN